MGNCFLHGNGGGTSLNYDVVQYEPGAELPESAEANTIAVFTNVDITGHIFSATEPENMANGEVWFATGTSSPVAFNALKKNGIEVYPMSAKQCVDGELVDVTARTYQDGEWVEWFTYVFSYGNTCEDLTGGWEGVARNCNGYNVGNIKGELILTDGTLTAKSYYPNASNYYGGTVQTKNKIDLAPYSRIVFHVTDFGNNSGGGKLVVGVTTDSTSPFYTMNASKEVTEAGDIAVDISAINTSCIVALCPWTSGAAGKTAYITVDAIRLEK